MNEEMSIDITENRVWIEIDNISVGFSKETFIGLIKQSEQFKGAQALRE